MKTQIINELDTLIQLTKDLDNVYIKNRLNYIKKMLLEEWNESDFYYEEIKKSLNYNEIINDLNELTNFNK